MNNNVRHSVGDKVVSLTSSPYRKKGDIFIINKTQYCSQCGIQWCDYGFKDKASKTSCACGNVQNSMGSIWAKSSAFAPLSDTSLQHAVEEENYELAAIIRDALKTEKV